MAFEKQKRMIRKKKFSKHFRENLKFGLVAAIGFIIAFAWRETLIGVTDSFILKYFNSPDNVFASVMSSLAITFLGVILIWIISRLLK